MALKRKKLTLSEKVKIFQEVEKIQLCSKMKW
jgi:hypothetical protein